MKSIEEITKMRDLELMRFETEQERIDMLTQEIKERDDVQSMQSLMRQVEQNIESREATRNRLIILEWILREDEEK